MNVKWVPKGKFRCAGTHIKPQFHVEERGASQTKSAARKCTATLRGFARGGVRDRCSTSLGGRNNQRRQSFSPMVFSTAAST